MNKEIRDTITKVRSLTISASSLSGGYCLTNTKIIMRRFTKTHNELRWLFPYFTYETEEQAEGWFDEYEDVAKSKLKFGYNSIESFSRDDMIDAFLKGASVAHQTLVLCHRDEVVCKNVENLCQNKLIEDITLDSMSLNLVISSLNDRIKNVKLSKDTGSNITEKYIGELMTLRDYLESKLSE